MTADTFGAVFVAGCCLLLRPTAIKAGILLKPGQRFGFHNFRHSLATFLVSRGKDVKTIQELLRHAKVSTTLDLYSQAIDAAKLAAQEEIALAIRRSAAEDQYGTCPRDLFGYGAILV